MEQLEFLTFYSIFYLKNLNSGQKGIRCRGLGDSGIVSFGREKESFLTCLAAQPTSGLCRLSLKIIFKFYKLKVNKSERREEKTLQTEAVNVFYGSFGPGLHVGGVILLCTLDTGEPDGSGNRQCTRSHGTAAAGF